MPRIAARMRTGTPVQPHRSSAAGPRIVPLVLGLAACAAAVAAAQSRMPAPEPGAPAAVYDAVATDTARILAGLAPSDAARFDVVVKQPAWRAYRADVNGHCSRLPVFLARIDARIVDIRMESPWSQAGPAAPTPTAQGPAAGAARRPPKRPIAVTIRFTAPGSANVQTLCYARVRMEDAEFSRQEVLLAYLDRHTPFTTMLKSASYLLHDGQFSRVRSLILGGSHAVLQDDTGVPFRFFEKSTWRLTLFGRYSPPVKDFSYGGQPDLEAAYRDTAAVHQLPFSFGYHWRQGTSSVMLAIRPGSVR